MPDIFAKHNQKKKFIDALFLYGFYTVLLYSFAMLIVVISDNHEICFFGYHCVYTNTHFLLSSFYLYIYILLLVIILIQTYKILEKILTKKNHITYFKYIFFAIPLLTLAIVWLRQTPKDDAVLLLLFVTIMSIAGLLMIELRKKG